MCSYLHLSHFPLQIWEQNCKLDKNPQECYFRLQRNSYIPSFSFSVLSLRTKFWFLYYYLAMSCSPTPPFKEKELLSSQLPAIFTLNKSIYPPLMKSDMQYRAQFTTSFLPFIKIVLQIPLSFLNFFQCYDHGSNSVLLSSVNKQSLQCFYWITFF